MAIQASVILSRASDTLFDETNVRWSVAQLLDYLNTSMKSLVIYKPDAYTKNVDYTLQSSLEQLLPDDANNLINVLYNRGTNGITPIKAIRQVDKNHLDNSDPNWYFRSGDSVEHFIYDSNDPLKFYVYPRPTLPWHVQIIYSATPPMLTSTTDVLPIPDIYENPLYFSTVAYALIKNFKAGDAQKASGYFSMFANALGVKMNMQRMYYPSNPDVPNGAG